MRPLRDGDDPLLSDIFHRAVRHGAEGHYSDVERAAWSPEPPTGPIWEARLRAADTLVAEMNGAVVGFMTLNIETGYLDYAYVAPEMMGKGVTGTLYAVLEGRARVAGRTELTTEASRLAERFFAKQGWQIVKRQEVERRGVKIANAVMSKSLKASQEVAA